MLDPPSRADGLQGVGADAVWEMLLTWRDA
jgi:hypothetical protein